MDCSPPGSSVQICILLPSYSSLKRIIYADKILYIIILILVLLFIFITLKINNNLKCPTVKEWPNKNTTGWSETEYMGNTWVYGYIYMNIWVYIREYMGNTCMCRHSVVSDLCSPIDCSPPGSSVHGLFQARILEWAAISSSRVSSQSRDWICVSCFGRRILYH